MDGSFSSKYLKYIFNLNIHVFVSKNTSNRGVGLLRPFSCLEKQIFKWPFRRKNIKTKHQMGPVNHTLEEMALPKSAV